MMVVMNSVHFLKSCSRFSFDRGDGIDDGGGGESHTRLNLFFLVVNPFVQVRRSVSE